MFNTHSHRVFESGEGNDLQASFLRHNKRATRARSEKKSAKEAGSVFFRIFKFS